VTTLGRWLVLGIAIVSGLGLAVELAHATGAINEQLLVHLSLSYEGNVPTWFSASLLLGCAIAAGAIAHDIPPGERGRRHWWGIAIALGYVSMDEAAEIHEHLGGLIGTHGIFYFDWVIPATGVLVVLAIVYWPFLWSLPRATRNRLLVAAAIYIGGAVGLELPLGWWYERHGNEGLTYALIDWVEETLEMCGATVALLALVAHRQRTR
jgi:hypothetical protein